jgi:oligoendopeptidase F
VKSYEAIDDLMGRLGSYAGLLHAGDTLDPARTKFYGDVQERLDRGVDPFVVLRA